VTRDTCNVLMVVQNSFYSDSRVLRIAGSIAARGVRVQLLALDAPGLPQRERVAGFDVKRLRLTSRAVSGAVGMPFKVSEYLAKVFAACLRSGAVVYHVHDPLPLAAAGLAARFTGAKIVYDVHELHFGMARLGRVRRFATRLYETIAVRGADRVIMSDGASRASLFRAAHRYNEPIDFIFNCPLPVEDPLRVNDLREAVGIPATTPLVVFTGHVGEDRALDRIISGMPAWPAEAHFVMLGKATAEAREWLSGVARNDRVRERVHFYGPVPPHDVVHWLMSADVASTIVENVGPSYYNSAPTKMFEAIMARRPQVASAFPEITRVVRDNPVGPVGELVDPNDADAITHAIVRLLSDKELREKYTRNADSLARNHFNWRIEEAKLYDIYNAIAPGLLATPGKNT
jgi:glycosyltransferase involved in cell wall biosynthesis